MAQGIEFLVKKDDVGKIKSRTPDWLLAGFGTEEEYDEFLKKLMPV